MMHQKRQPHRNERGWRGAVAVAVTLLCLTGVHAAQTAGAQPGDLQAKQVAEDFLARVSAYVKLRAHLKATMPKLKTTDQPGQLAEHDKALAAKMLDARKDAKPDDIFTKDISEQFRQRISQELRGQQGRDARQTIRQGEPVALQVHVNQIYPAKLPRTTVPPTLLLKLPKLPKGIEYRIVGRTFALVDIESSMVIDYIPDAIPAPAPQP